MCDLLNYIVCYCVFVKSIYMLLVVMHVMQHFIFVFFFSRIRKKFVYHFIKKNSLTIKTTRFKRVPKEVDLK
jgi:hypothetical protein